MILAFLTIGEGVFIAYDKYFGNTHDEDIIELKREVNVLIHQLKGEGDPDKRFKDNHRVDLIHGNLDRYNTPKASFAIIDGQIYISNFDRSLGSWVYKNKSGEWLTIPND